MAQGKKISQFTIDNTISDSALLTFVENGTNFTITYANFKAGLDITGTLVSVGDPLAVPVLQVDGTENQIRSIESGAGISASVSPENGVLLNWNIAQDSNGVSITSGLTNDQPVMASLVAGDGINLVKTDDEILVSSIAGEGGLDQAQIIYLATAGSDAKSGLNIDNPKKTMEAAITAAEALLPTAENQIIIQSTDGGVYTGDVNVPSFVHIMCHTASWNGKMRIADSCLIHFRSAQNGDSTSRIFRKDSGTGEASVTLEALFVVGAGQEGVICDSGRLFFRSSFTTVDAGHAMKAKNGSEIVFSLGEVNLTNGGICMGTKDTDGDGNFYSGSVLNVIDDGTGILMETRVDGDEVNLFAGHIHVDTLYDLGVNSTLSTFITSMGAGAAMIADPTATIKKTLAGVSNFNSTTDIIIDRVLEAVSLSTNQDPTGLGIANAVQIEFGVAQFTSSEPVMIDVNGLVTFNVTGMYRVKSVFQFGRTGASGTSKLLFRLLVDGVQLGRSVGVNLGNSDDLDYIDIDNWFNVPAGTTLSTEIMRDNSGDNSGGIVRTEPTDEGAGTWEPVPCTILRIERWASP